MASEFVLPELGENVDSATVTGILVAVGDVVAVDDPLIEIETDKAAAEVPSDVAGKVTEIMVSEGDTVRVGQVVLKVGDTGGSGGETPPRLEPEPEPEPKPEPEATPAPKPEPKTPASPPPPLPRSRPAASKGEVHASPAVRRLAREIGVDLADVAGTGRGARITLEDVKVHAKQAPAEAPSPVADAARPAAAPKGARVPDGSKWGPIEREAMSGVRRATAEHMARCWATVPHVTHFDRADITEFERFRKRHGPKVEAQGGKLTVTAVLVKILGSALQRFPKFNASIDPENNEIIYKKYYHVGVAVDTERGLLVPVIRDVDQKSIAAIAAELAGAADRARAGKSALNEMQGGTFTVSNLGGIGGTGFTPIVNLPEVAILGVSRARIEPVYTDGSFEPRTLLPLALSYDHRVIDGADGARFLRWVAEALEQPLVLLLDD